jgi:hypothetical protein
MLKDVKDLEEKEGDRKWTDGQQNDKLPQMDWRNEIVLETFNFLLSICPK